MADDQDSLEFRWHRDPDVRLMLKVRDDQPGAFEEILAKYQNRLVAVLFHLVGNAQDAEDLAQTVFLRIHKNRKEYVPKAKFSTWLFTIANNLALNAKRDGRRRPISVTSDNSDESGPMLGLDQMVQAPSGASPSRVFAKAELAQLVRTAVNALPKDQRTAVILNKFEEMSYKDIAEVLGKSEMAVKSLLSRARLSLKAVLEPYLQVGKKPEGM